MTWVRPGQPAPEYCCYLTADSRAPDVGEAGRSAAPDPAAAAGAAAPDPGAESGRSGRYGCHCYQSNGPCYRSLLP